MSPYRGAIVYSVFIPLIRKAIVFNAVPVAAGSCIASFAATVKPIDSSSELLAVANAPPDLLSDSPIPVDEIANSFNLLLSAIKAY